MEAISTPLSGVKVITPTIHGDERGFFKEVIHPQKLAALGINHRFVQMNHSRSQQWTLRGLHFQLPPYGQSKLVRCLRGRIYDVAVDVRPKSPTFGQSFGIELSEENHKMLYVPVGFAHGFLALTDCDIEYACGDMYAVDFERSIAWNDVSLGIKWPLDGNVPILSQKDAAAPKLKALNDQLHWPHEVYAVNDQIPM